MSERVDKSRVLAELQSLRLDDGGWDPRRVVDYARRHPTSELHKLFQWDIDEAAMQYWLDQARTIIKTYIVVVEKNSNKPIDVVVSVPSLRGKEGAGSYQMRSKVINREAWRKQLVKEGKTQLRSIMATYGSIAPELKPVWNAIKKHCG